MLETLNAKTLLKISSHLLHRSENTAADGDSRRRDDSRINPKFKRLLVEFCIGHNIASSELSLYGREISAKDSCMPYYVREIAGVKGLDGEYLLDLSVFLREHGHPKWAKQVLHNINSDDALNLLFEKGILSLYIKNLNAMYETHNMSQHDKRFYEDNLAYLFSYCLKREGGCSESLIFQIIRASRNASYQGLFIAISSILSQLEHDRSDASYLMIKEMLKPYITGSNIVARQVIYTLLMNLGPHHSTGKALHVLLEDKQIRKSFQMTVDELGLKARL